MIAMERALKTFSERLKQHNSSPCLLPRDTPDTPDTPDSPDSPDQPGTSEIPETSTFSTPASVSEPPAHTAHSQTSNSITQNSLVIPPKSSLNASPPFSLTTAGGASPTSLSLNPGLSVNRTTTNKVVSDSGPSVVSTKTFVSTTTEGPSSPPNPTKSIASAPSQGHLKGEIAGGIAGGVIALILILLLTVVLIRRRRRKRTQQVDSWTVEALQSRMQTIYQHTKHSSGDNFQQDHSSRLAEAPSSKAVSTANSTHLDGANTIYSVQNVSSLTDASIQRAYANAEKAYLALPASIINSSVSGGAPTPESTVPDTFRALIAQVVMEALSSTQTPATTESSHDGHLQIPNDRGDGSPAMFLRGRRSSIGTVTAPPAYQEQV